MTFQHPWALLAGVVVALVWWAHRRASAGDARAYSGFFFLDADTADGRRGARVRSPLLLALRWVGVMGLVMALSGPAFDEAPATLVLTDGPIEPDPAWTSPVTYVRAGTPPTLHRDAAAIRPLDGVPNWGGALLLGRRDAADATLVRRLRPRDEGGITSAGAVLDGDAVVVTATVMGRGEPALSVGGEAHKMAARNGDFFLRAPLAPGIAVVTVAGGRPWPVCVPDAAPLRVASRRLDSRRFASSLFSSRA